MFFQCLSFMALYGSAMNQPGNIIPHSRDLGVGSAWQTFCSSHVEEATALNQPGSITPHSYAQCSLRHLGVGLGGQNFCSNLMEKLENVANLSPVRVSQRGMVYFSRNALCENSQKQIGNDTHPSRALRHLGGSLYWSPLNQPGNITPPFLCPLLYTTSGCGFGWAKLLLQPSGSVLSNKLWLDGYYIFWAYIVEENERIYQNEG